MRLQIEREEVERLARDRDDELAILERNIYSRLKTLIMGKTAVKGPKGIKAGSEINDELLETLSRGQWWQLALGEEADAKEVEALHDQYEAQKRASGSSVSTTRSKRCAVATICPPV